MPAPLLAVVSYQSADGVAAELLHEEMAFRGLSVAHDQCTFGAGSRLGQTMEDAVATCDGFVAYLTPNSLYELSPPGVLRPALDAEFKPAMDRRARSIGVDEPSRRPVIIPLVHGLGEPRSEAPERVRRASGKDIATIWMPVVLDQSTVSLTQPEAAAVARCLVEALLPAGSHVTTLEPLDLAVTTRGDGQAAGFLSVDGTGLLGGRTNRPGRVGLGALP